MNNKIKLTIFIMAIILCSIIGVNNMSPNTGETVEYSNENDVLYSTSSLLPSVMVYISWSLIDSLRLFFGDRLRVYRHIFS